MHLPVCVNACMSLCVCERVWHPCVNLPCLLGSWPTTFRGMVPVFLLTFNPQPIYTIASATYRHHMRSSVIHPNRRVFGVNELPNVKNQCLACSSAKAGEPGPVSFIHRGAAAELQLSSPRNWLAEEGENVPAVYHWCPNWRRKMIVNLEPAPFSHWWNCKIIKIVIIIMMIIITKTTSKRTKSAISSICEDQSDGKFAQTSLPRRRLRLCLTTHTVQMCNRVGFI